MDLEAGMQRPRSASQKASNLRGRARAHLGLFAVVYVRARFHFPKQKTTGAPVPRAVKVTVSE